MITMYFCQERKRKMRTTSAIICVVAIIVALGMWADHTQGSVITADMTVDNYFGAYLSTDDTQKGALIGSGSNWPTTYTFQGTLTSSVTNYLHIEATDVGPPAAFIGDFSLDDTNFAFANGTQTLVTNSAHWSVSRTGFAQDYEMPDQIGLNGVPPWGLHSPISANAYWIWTNMGQDGNTTRYFSTPIIYVPEPVTLSLLAIGGLAVLRRRRR